MRRRPAERVLLVACSMGASRRYFSPRYIELDPDQLVAYMFVELVVKKRYIPVPPQINNVHYTFSHIGIFVYYILLFIISIIIIAPLYGLILLPSKVTISADISTPSTAPATVILSSTVTSSRNVLEPTNGKTRWKMNGQIGLERNTLSL